MDISILLWTVLGAGALGLAFLDYKLSLKRRTRLGKFSE